MVYFFKKDCKKCTWLKEQVNLNEIEGLEVHELTKSNYESLGLLAFYEGVGMAETTLPILVLDNGQKVTGVIKIRDYLKGRK